MSKRFTDTDKWKKQWYMNLPSEMKLLWIYLLDNCNHAGVWDVNIKLVNIYLETNLDTDKIMKYFSKHIVILDEDKWFLPKFIEFQYGELNKNVPAHKSVINILNKYNLLQPINNTSNSKVLANSYLTVKEQLPNSLGTVKEQLLNGNNLQVPIKSDVLEQLGNSSITLQDKDKDKEEDKNIKYSLDNKNNLSSEKISDVPKNKKSKKDYIDELYDIWTSTYLEMKSVKYVTAAYEIERSMTGKILQSLKEIWKTNGSKYNDEQAKTKVKNFFKACLNITDEDDKFISNNMTLSMIVNQMPKIMNIIQLKIKNKGQSPSKYIPTVNL